MAQLGVQHRSHMPDSGAVYMWPSAQVRDGGLEEASPVGCPSASWPPVGGQVSPNLRLKGSKQARGEGCFLHKLLWLPGPGLLLFSCPLEMPNDHTGFFQTPLSGAKNPSANGAASAPRELAGEAHGTNITEHLPGARCAALSVTYPGGRPRDQGS